MFESFLVHYIPNTLLKQYGRFKKISYNTHTNKWSINELLVGIKTLKARHDVTMLDLTIHLLSLWCIDIDLSI